MVFGVRGRTGRCRRRCGSACWRWPGTRTTPASVRRCWESMQSACWGCARARRRCGGGWWPRGCGRGSAGGRSTGAVGLGAPRGASHAPRPSAPARPPELQAIETEALERRRSDPDRLGFLGRRWRSVQPWRPSLLGRAGRDRAASPPTPGLRPGQEPTVHDHQADVSTVAKPRTFLLWLDNDANHGPWPSARSLLPYSASLQPGPSPKRALSQAPFFPEPPPGSGEPPACPGPRQGGLGFAEAKKPAAYIERLDQLAEVAGDRSERR